MYKVFHNRHTIIFNSSTGQNTGHEREVLITDSDIHSIHKQVHDLLNAEESSSIIVCHPNFADIQREFCSLYYPIQASGGVVLCEEGVKTLIIKRKGYWDLPKGKCEADESTIACAIRETSEETGITGLTVTSAPFITKHIYEMKSQKWYMKTTYWYQMRTSDQTVPVPQLDEGITEARWATQEGLQHSLLPNTYPMIREVLNHFQLT